MISSLHIKTAARQGATCLQSSYYTTPLKIANITEDQKAARLQLMLMSSSPGILDGDNYQITIEMGQGSSLDLHTQSYQRLFNMQGAASQRFHLHMEANCSFCFLPHPAVPHEASAFTSVNRAYMSENCTLVLGEILTCGRKLTGETFLFSKYHSVTEIFLRGKLVVRENLLLEPRISDPLGIGMLEGFSHQASLLFLHPEKIKRLLVSNIVEQLGTEPGIIFGVSETPVNGLVVRILGSKAEQLHGCLRKLAATLPQIPRNETTSHAI